MKNEEKKDFLALQKEVKKAVATKDTTPLKNKKPIRRPHAD